METYNDDWCQCPICFEIYSIEHRPTTFICGHSVCIDHVYGPVCRHPLKSLDQYHISYSLEDAVRLFNQLKNSIYWDISVRKKEEEKKIVNANVKKLDNYDYSYEEELKRNECLLDEMYPSQAKSCDYQTHLTTYSTHCLCAVNFNARSIGSDVKGRRSRARVNDGYCPVCKQRC